MADFIHTRCVWTGLSRAFTMSAWARSGSSFSNSSLNAASQIASESAFAANACAPGRRSCAKRWRWLQATTSNATRSREDSNRSGHRFEAK